MSEATKRSRDRKENGKCTNATNCRSRVGLSTSFCIPFLKSLDRFSISWIRNNAKSIDFNLLFTYSLVLFLRAKKNIVRFSHENIGIFKEFRSIVNMLLLWSEIFFYIFLKYTVWNTWFQSLRCLGLKLTILQAFLPSKMVKGMGPS